MRQADSQGQTVETGEQLRQRTASSPKVCVKVEFEHPAVDPNAQQRHLREVEQEAVHAGEGDSAVFLLVSRPLHGALLLARRNLDSKEWREVEIARVERGGERWR